MSLYIELFKSNEDIIREYEAPADALEGAEVLLAWYGYGSYEGDSMVIFRRDGKLWHVKGGHCSCYGLEGQWDPTETSVAQLAKLNIYDGCDGSAEAQAGINALVERLSVNGGAANATSAERSRLQARL